MKAGIAAVLLIAAAGCASSPVLGGIYTNVKWNAETDGRLGTREGRACAKSVLGLFATGDASIATAALAGGVKEITTVDRSTKTVLFLYGEYCTIARGEGDARSAATPPAPSHPAAPPATPREPVKVIPSYDPRTCRDGFGNLVDECWRAKGRN